MIRLIIKKIKNYKPTDKKFWKPLKYLDDKSLNIYGIQILFILIAVLCGCIFFFNHGSQFLDPSFHLDRLKDIGLETIHGQFPQYDFYSGMPVGNAINTFYPWILEIPLALILLVMKPELAFGIWEITITLISLETIYYIFHKTLEWTRFTACLMAMFQVVCSFTVLSIADFGAITFELAILFLNIAFAGWIKWIQRDKWKMMACGVCGVLFTDLPYALITISLLAILTVLQWKQLTWNKIIKGCKAAFITVGMWCMYWFPVIMIEITNEIYRPNKHNIKSGGSGFFSKHLIVELTPYGYTVWDLIDLLAIILIIIYWKKLDTFIRQISIVAIIMIGANIPPISHFLQHHQPVELIQFTNRFTLVSHFLLLIALLYILNIIYKNVHHKKWLINGCYIELMAYILLLIAAVGLLDMTSYQKSKHISNYRLNHYSERTTSMSLKLNQHRSHKWFTNLTATTLHTNNTLGQTPDYLPISVLPFRMRRKLNFKTYHYYKNGMNFTENHPKIKVLPFTIYHTQKYNITDNNKPLKYKYYHHWIKANLHKGQNRIRVTAPVMWYRYVGPVVSLVSLGGLIFLDRKRKR